MKKKCLFTALFLGCILNGVFAQIDLKGKVVDEKGRPVPGANVRLEQTTIGCATNSKGEFSLKNIADGKYVLRASCLDYDATTQKIDKSNSNLVIRLKESYINLNQVVVTGTGTHHKLKDTPIPIQVLSAADIKKTGATGFEEAIRNLVPSISFNTTGMGTTLSMNGLNGKYILFLENGKRMTGETAGNINFERIDMSRVKRIEVLKGAASALYGSDAIAGVINIITEEPKNMLNITSNSYYGSHNKFSQTAGVDVRTGKLGSFTSYQRLQSDGWQLNPMEEKKGELVPTVKEAFNGFYSNTVNQKFTFAATKKLSFYLRGTFFNRETKRPIEAYDYNMRHEDFVYGAGAQYLLGNTSYIDVDYHADNFSSKYAYIKDTKSYKEGETVLRKRLRMHDLNAKGVFRTSGINKLTTGVEFIHDYVKNIDDMEGGDHEMNTLSLYAQDELRLWKSFQAVGGLRYMYNEDFGSHVTPNVSLMYTLGAFNIRGSYAAGFRSPTLYQRYAYSESKSGDKVTLGNPDLKPETSHYVTGNIEYVNNRFTISFSGYVNNLKDLISNVSIDPLPDGTKQDQWQNVEKARVKGFDISFNAYLGSGLSVSGGYNFADGKNLTTRERLDKSVKHSANVNGNWSHVWKQYRLNVNLNGRIQSERWSHSYGYSPKFQIWSLNTRHLISRVGAFDFEPGAGIDNIFNYKDDRPWNSNYSTIDPGRTFYVSLLVRFKQ